MKPTEQTDSIDALLREKNTYIDDAGFTARVIKVLPRRRLKWKRPAILLTATAIGSMLAMRWLPWGDLTALDPAALLSHDYQTLMPWMIVGTVVASLVWGATAALQTED